MDRNDVTTELIDRETDRLVSTTARLTDEQVRGPSLCEGWSRGHVLTHLARNAEGIARAARAATEDSGETMYAGVAERDADIDAGAGRSAAELTGDLRRTAAQLTPFLSALEPRELADVRVPRTPGGPTFPAASLPFMRLREVVVHHIDLDAGFGFEDVDDDISRLLLSDTLDRLRATQGAPALTIETSEGDHGVIGAGGTQVTGPRASVLRWLLRQDGSGVRSGDAPLPAVPHGI